MKPVINVFAREVTEPLTSLVKKVDEQIAQHEDKSLCGFVVVLTEDSDATASELEKVAKDGKVSHVPLTLFEGAGPPITRSPKTPMSR